MMKQVQVKNKTRNKLRFAIYPSIFFLQKLNNYTTIFLGFMKRDGTKRNYGTSGTTHVVSGNKEKLY